jgi:hypothetical protein
MNLSKGKKEKVDNYFQRISSENYKPNDQYQNVTVDDITNVLQKLGQYSNDKRDAIWCLLNNELPSLFPNSTCVFSSGASCAHIGGYMGFLLRSANRRLDREGRDYWLKPLIDIGAIEAVTYANNVFTLGHIKAKSPHSAYRLSTDFIHLLQSYRKENFDEIYTDYVNNVDERLKTFAALVRDNIASQGISPHKQLIQDSIEIYAQQYLPGYRVVFTDCEDGDRITDNEHILLNDAGIVFGQLQDVWPDVILYNEERNALWFIEAVTSDGEVDAHKMIGLHAICDNSGKAFAGATTTYPDWQKFASRQHSENNLVPNTYVWIRESPNKIIEIK